jgi:hypothetical protein
MLVSQQILLYAEPVRVLLVIKSRVEMCFIGKIYISACTNKLYRSLPMFLLFIF